MIKLKGIVHPKMKILSVFTHPLSPGVKADEGDRRVKTQI